MSNEAKLSKFKLQVYEWARKVPVGKVVTYGQLAKLAGYPGAARAVGMCMRTNPDMPQTPCHRVVGAGGRLVGYAGGGVGMKRKMLEAEGVKFKGDKVDLETAGWQPKWANETFT